jgi:hypothetical protein
MATEGQKILYTQLTFALCDLFPENSDRNGPHEIRLQFQNGGLRRPTLTDCEGRKNLERVLIKGASIPEGFSGDVFISRNGTYITGCRWKEKSAGGPDDPPRSFTV